jgi:pyruvate carboxylase
MIQPIVDASLKLAGHLKYKGLGTFEYLFNVQSQDWVFLEINPRVQVEHTITGKSFGQ